MWAKNPGVWGRNLVLRPEYIGTSDFKIFGRYLLVAPGVITFFGESYSVFFDFISRIEKAANKGPVLIDISAVREVKAAAMLVLFSTIEIVQIRYRDKNRIKLTAASHRSVSRSFWRAGFWSLTSQTESLPKYKRLNKGLEICTASYSATKAGDESQLRKVVDYAQSMVLEGGLDGEADLLAYNAITESVSNVWQHAYDADFFNGEVDTELAHWWISVERIKDQFYIVVYDRGAGIPETLQRKPWYKVAFVDAQGNVKSEIAVDALRIKLAVEYGSSRFKNDNRGKGLSEAKDFVNTNPKGTMIIYSGYGDYTFYSESKKEDLTGLPSKFIGTMIQWNLQLESKT